MKSQSFHFLIVVFFLSIYGYSCSKKGIEIKNQNQPETGILSGYEGDIQTITRAELAALPIHEQVDIFNQLTDVNKFRIYSEKFQYVKETYGLSLNEKDYLDSFFLSFDSEVYDSTYNYENLENWVDSGIVRFGWSLNQTFFMFYTVGDSSEYAAAMMMDDGNTGGGGTNPPLKCVCRYDISCGLAAWDCSDDNHCVATTHGCGIIGSSRCSGECLPW